MATMKVPGSVTNPDPNINGMYQQYMQDLPNSQVSYTPVGVPQNSYGNIAEQVSRYMQPYLRKSVKARNDQSRQAFAATDTDAYARGMGQSSYVTDQKVAEHGSRVNDIADINASYLDQLAQEVSSQYNSHLTNVANIGTQNASKAIEAAQYNAQQEIDREALAFSRAVEQTSGGLTPYTFTGTAPVVEDKEVDAKTAFVDAVTNAYYNQYLNTLPSGKISYTPIEWAKKSYDDIAKDVSGYLGSYTDVLKGELSAESARVPSAVSRDMESRNVDGDAFTADAFNRAVSAGLNAAGGFNSLSGAVNAGRANADYRKYVDLALGVDTANSANQLAVDKYNATADMNLESRAYSRAQAAKAQIDAINARNWSGGGGGGGGWWVYDGKRSSTYTNRADMKAAVARRLSKYRD